eukprot:5374297-Pleurochrysis_carterae.AAC.2
MQSALAAASAKGIESSSVDALESSSVDARARPLIVGGDAASAPNAQPQQPRARLDRRLVVVAHAHPATQHERVAHHRQAGTHVAPGQARQPRPRALLTKGDKRAIGCHAQAVLARTWWDC